MMAWIRHLLGIEPTDTTQLRVVTREQRQLARLARAERTDMIFKTLVAEVRK